MSGISLLGPQVFSSVQFHSRRAVESGLLSASVLEFSRGEAARSRKVEGIREGEISYV